MQLNAQNCRTYSFVFLLLSFIFFPICAQAKLDKPPVYLGLLAPLTNNTSAEAGQNMLNSVQMYLDKANAEGGVNGHPLKLLVFDSQGEIEIGIQEAQKIAQDKRILIVLGHYFSTIAMHTTKIFGEAKMPAMTSAVVANQVIEGNDWFFMINPSSKLTGITIAHIVTYLGELKKINVVYQPNDTYSYAMYQDFKQPFEALGGNIEYAWELSASVSLGDEQTFISLAQQIKHDLADDKETAIFIPVTTASSLVIALRRQGIKNPIMGDNNLGALFLNNLKNTPEEKHQPGAFSENIFLTPGFLFDTAGQEAQEFRQAYKQRFNNKEPDSVSSFTYDSAKLVVTALRAIYVDDNDIQTNRTALKDYLLNMTIPAKGITGVTGLTYFNKSGYAINPPVLGVIKNQHIVSALTQFKPVPNPKLLRDLEEEMAAKNIFIADGKYFYKTHVIQTNFEIIDIAEIDTDNKTALLEFYLWFSHHNSANPTPIEFLNAAESIELGEPVETTQIHRYAYAMYHVKGRFYIDYLPQYKNKYILDEHIIGVQFQHKNLPYNRLVYVNDLFSSPISSRGAQEQIARNLVRFAEAWKIKEFSTYQDVISKPARGNPDYEEYGDTVEFSRFNQVRLVESKKFTLRRQISGNTAWLVFATSFLTFIVITLIRAIYFGGCQESIAYKMIWGIQMLVLALVLLSIEPIILTRFIDSGIHTLHNIQITFDIGWWLLPAYVLASGISNFVWARIEKHGGAPVPPLMRNMVSFIIYMCAIFGIVAFVFNMKITSLLATSGMFAMIIGLAVQMNISNIFSGIAINIDRPFRIGDWVKIDNYPLGKVLNTTWRATRIQTGEGSILSIPNAIAADSTVYNYNYPNDICLSSQVIYIDFKHSPEKVQHIILVAMQSVKGILSDPPPSVGFRIGEWANEYVVSFRMHGYDNKARLSNAINSAIYKSLNKAQITPVQRTTIS